MFRTTVHAFAALVVGVAGVTVTATPAAAVPPGCTQGDTITTCNAIDYDGMHGLDAYYPNGAVDAPIVIVIHGAGWRAGNRSQLTAEARYFAENGFAALNIDYTLSTKKKASWPQALDDVEAAYDWAVASASTYGWDGSSIASFGTSSGGHLAAMLYTVGVDDGHPVQTAVTWSAPMDLPVTYSDGTDKAKSAVTQFLGCIPGSCPGNPPRDLAASPDANVAPDDPPILFFHSRNDPTVPSSNGPVMDEALAAAGVPHEFVRLRGDTHGARIRCQDAVVAGYEGNVAEGTARWLAHYLLPADIVPTPFDSCPRSRH